jgi:predicted nucleic acid-binding protein
VYLLDTNIVSLLDTRRQALVPGLVPWLRRNGAHLFLSVITLTELEAGILKLRREAKATRAAEFETLRDAIQADFGDRILCLDAPVAVTVAHLAEAARPHVIELADLIVAATAKVHGLIVMTRNRRHFEPTGLAVVDPALGLPTDVAP